ncbi:MAG: hypothetical protein AB7V32_05380 [Candidatus Berkiella sp.]
MNKDKDKIKQSDAIWWIPAIVLLAVIVPKNLSWNTAYLEFGMPTIGLFFAWLLAKSLVKAKDDKQYINKAWIYLLLILIYNPLTYKYSLVYFFASKSFAYLIILNLSCAVLLIYLWWQEKAKK